MTEHASGRCAADRLMHRVRLRRRVAKIVRMPFVLLFAGIAACDSPSGPTDDLPNLRASALLTHLEFLAADSLFGRRAGSVHERRAAEYIGDEFDRYRLQPGVSGYLQVFPIPFPVDDQTGLQSQNVLGVLPGAGGLAEQWIIVGAHYDHLGIGAHVGTDSIYNGADDNGSGTALLLEIARVLSDRFLDGGSGMRPRRSIMFQAYGAEEVGLTGSRHFCAQPTVPMDRVIAMINMDMVGRLGNDPLGLLGASSSLDWTSVVARANTEALQVSFANGLTAGSDHRCFYEHRKPVLFLHTGLHAQYHQPTDEVGLIDTEGMVRVGNLAAALLLELAVRSEPPRFAN